MPHRARITRCIWAACLLLAGINHARILLQHGLSWDYHGAGWISAAYWSSLTLIDPLVAVLLLARPAVGVPAALILIVTNVAHNIGLTALHAPDNAFHRDLTDPMLLSQIAFLAFVVSTWRMARSDLRRGGRHPATRQH